MKIGQSVHIDPGALFGILLSLLGAIPEIVNSPSFKQIVPEKYWHIAILVGLAITAMRGQVIRREQFREAEAKPEVIEEKKAEDDI